MLFFAFFRAIVEGPIAQPPLMRCRFRNKRSTDRIAMQIAAKLWARRLSGRSAGRRMSIWATHLAAQNRSQTLHQHADHGAQNAYQHYREHHVKDNSKKHERDPKKGEAAKCRPTLLDVR
jgi:hypothetical protein